MSDTKPWEEYPEFWKTQSAFMSWLRGGLRKGVWNRHPVKLSFLTKNRFKKLDGYTKKDKKPKYVFAATCALCHQDHKLANIEVDHKQGGHSLRTIDDIMDFVKGIVLVNEADLQLVCKPCHKAKSYSEKEGLSFEDAVIEKQVIAAAKDSKAWLLARGLQPATNATKRRDQIRGVLTDERTNGTSQST